MEICPSIFPDITNPDLKVLYQDIFLYTFRTHRLSEIDFVFDFVRLHKPKDLLLFRKFVRRIKSSECKIANCKKQQILGLTFRNISTFVGNGEGSGEYSHYHIFQKIFRKALQCFG